MSFNSNIINCSTYTFGEHGIRNGDMIAIINILQWLRNHQNNQSLQFYLPREYIINNDYNLQFFDYLQQTYDYFSVDPNTSGKQLPYENIMLWDFRDNIGDVVNISNTKSKDDKVVVFPVLDATYNTLRNWPKFIFEGVLRTCQILYPNQRKILCLKEDINFDYSSYGFELSTDFITNINHIETAKVFVGGDTGSSHYASALSNGPDQLIYYYTARSMIHSLPFHLFNGRGLLKTYSTEYNMELFK